MQNYSPCPPPFPGMARVEGASMRALSSVCPVLFCVPSTGMVTYMEQVFKKHVLNEWMDGWFNDKPSLALHSHFCT